MKWVSALILSLLLMATAHADEEMYCFLAHEKQANVSLQGKTVVAHGSKEEFSAQVDLIKIDCQISDYCLYELFQKDGSRTVIVTGLNGNLLYSTYQDLDGQAVGCKKKPNNGGGN